MSTTFVPLMDDDGGGGGNLTATGSLSFAGSLATAVSKGKTNTGSLSFAGSLATELSTPNEQNVAGSLSLSGSLAAVPGASPDTQDVEGGLSFSSVLLKNLFSPILQDLTRRNELGFSGSLATNFGRSLTGSLSLSGSLQANKNASDSQSGAGSLSFGGSLQASLQSLETFGADTVVRRPLSSSHRTRPLPATDRQTQHRPRKKLFLAYLSPQEVLPGDRIYPMGTLLVPKEDLSNIRWRVDGGAWNTVTIGSNTDLLGAARAITDVVTSYATRKYDVELTRQSDGGKITIHSDILVRIKSTSNHRFILEGNKIRPFANFSIISDPTLIASVKYSVSGASVIGKQAIKREVYWSGSHSGSNNSPTLQDSSKNFTHLGIRLNKDIVANITDGSEGVITDVTSTDVTATLSGGGGNDWDTNDNYEIRDGDTLDVIARRFAIELVGKGEHVVTLYVEDTIGGESSKSVVVTVN